MWSEKVTFGRVRHNRRRVLSILESPKSARLSSFQFLHSCFHDVFTKRRKTNRSLKKGETSPGARNFLRHRIVGVVGYVYQ